MPQATLLDYFSSPTSKPRPLLDPKKRKSVSSGDLDQSSRVSMHLHPLNEVEISEDDRHKTDVSSKKISSEHVDNQIAIPHIPQASITKFEHVHLAAIQRLTSTTLQVKYPDKFFIESMQEPHLAPLSRVALYEGEPVGWIRCRLEQVLPNAGTNTVAVSDKYQLYIQALCLLAPYRGHGLATLLLDTILCSEFLSQHNVPYVYAHVWEKNDIALEWYEKRGFKRVVLVDQYYRKLKPASAWVLRKDLSSS